MPYLTWYLLLIMTFMYIEYIVFCLTVSPEWLLIAHLVPGYVTVSLHVLPPVSVMCTYIACKVSNRIPLMFYNKIDGVEVSV